MLATFQLPTRPMWPVAIILDGTSWPFISLQKVLLDSDILVIQDTSWKYQAMEGSVRELVLKPDYYHYLQLMNTAGTYNDYT